MPTTTTTVTVTNAEEGALPTTTTTTTTASRQLLPAVAKCSLLVRAPASKVAPLIAFDTLIGNGPLAAIVACEVTAGDEIGSVRHITGIAGGPFEGKVLSETCLDNVNGHSTYLLHLRSLFHVALPSASLLYAHIQRYLGVKLGLGCS